MRILLAAGAALALAACAGGGSGEPDAGAPSARPAESPTAEPSADPTPTCDRIAAVAALPLDTRIRQLLFAGVYTGEPDPIASATAAAAAGVGGINFLGNDAGVYASGELAGVTSAGGSVPPFLAVDQEGGRVQRLRTLIGDLPSARELGSTMAPEQVRALAGETGAAMARLGLNMDLAPVADVSDQPAGSVIGDRAFSNDPAEVASYAGAFADGLRDEGIIPVLKHFPGIGSASGNTDLEPATSPPLDQLLANDLLPYRTLLAPQPTAVMMGTAVVQGLTDGAPAALSPAAVDLLRTGFAFDGVVMTDSLSGAAVDTLHPLPRAAELALQAGVDMVLWDSTAEIESVVATLTEAVASGRLSEDRVNTSAARVLALKGIDACGPAD